MNAAAKTVWVLTALSMSFVGLSAAFIFGSVKANPWWGNVLMQIIFILWAMVSGIALCVFNYRVLSWIRRKTMDMKCKP